VSAADRADCGDAKRIRRARWLGMALIAVALARQPFVAAPWARGWVRIIDFACVRDASHSS